MRALGGTKFVIAVFTVAVMIGQVNALTWNIGPVENPGAVTATLGEETLVIRGEGDMADYSRDNLPPWFSGRSLITAITIEYGVTSIGDWAFLGCSKLTSVIIPNSVTSIGQQAFANTGLTSIIIPNSVVTIGQLAFFDCTDLTSVIIGNGVVSIGQMAFQGCANLSSITFLALTPPTGVSFDGANTAAICLRVPRVSINAYRSANLGFLCIKSADPDDDDDGITAILRDGTLIVSGKGNMENYDRNNLPPWFDSRRLITAIIIGDGITSIGDNAFSGSIALTSVTIPNSVTSIGQQAFQGCNRLTSIVIPNSVTTIGQAAFANCTRLVSVTLGDGVVSIGQSAFEGCASLASINIPNSVTTIGHQAFLGCASLSSIVIPNSVTTIGNWVFSGCTGLASVTIPNTVTSIGQGAFAKNAGLTSIAALTPTPPVIVSGVSPFSEVNKTAVCLYVPETGVDAYRAAAVWKDFACIKTIDPGHADGGGITATLTNDTLTISGRGAMENYDRNNLPPWIENRNSITTIIIEDGVTSIGNNAFSGCGALTSVTIPNSVTSIGQQAFQGCARLASISIPSSVRTIGQGAFANCTSLDSVIIPSGVTSIAQSMFQGCTGLTSVTIPNSVTSIGHQAFLGCTGLTSITISNNVTSIGNRAFSGCTGLTSITIPNSVASIGQGAFADCVRLSSITVLLPHPPVVGPGAPLFLDVDKSSACLYVPRGSVSTYRAAVQWRDFRCINEAP
ncbi:MAG: leucine-rich repeat domain-containing protein [Chitinispirillales bacterium]|jgi:hypothetical protein|nr:leucine-rich repeat domain-containing protein [Chitinispirillales bacterium]